MSVMKKMKTGGVLGWLLKSWHFYTYQENTSQGIYVKVRKGIQVLALESNGPEQALSSYQAITLGEPLALGPRLFESGPLMKLAARGRESAIKR